MTEDLNGPTAYDFPKYYEEKDRRRALVDAMPGRKHQAHVQNLKRAHAILEGNRTELERHFQYFIQSTQFAGDMGDFYKGEMVRLFHNYLAAVGSLRDIQRTIHRKLWPEKDPSKSKKKGNDSNQKTIWEEKVYSPKVQEHFGVDKFVFLQYLRNYTLHYSLPVPTGSTTLRFGQHEPYTHENRFLLRRDTLLEYSNWPTAARGFLESQPKLFEFHPIIERYSEAVEKFSEWFTGVVLEKLSPEYPDYTFTKGELEYWMAEYQIVIDWKQSQQGASRITAPPPETRFFRRELSRMKAMRWAHGSRGWRIFTASSEGTVVLPPEHSDPWGLPWRSPHIAPKSSCTTPPDTDESE